MTEHLVIRCWSSEDAMLLREAIDSSLDHLRPWMPWAMKEPDSLDGTEARLANWVVAFAVGDDFTYGIFTPDESTVVGGCGLHRRAGPDALEIGYWIRADRVRRGYATETARELTEAGLAMDDIERIRILCDPDNVASRRVPERLGYRLIEHRRGDQTTPEGRARDTLVFETTGPVPRR